MKVDGREAILFLVKNSIFIYNGSGIVRLEVPTNILRDIEVIDKSGMDSLLDTLIKTRKLEPARLWMVLSDSVCFSKEITGTDPVKSEEQIKDFLDAVPIDQIVSKKYRSQTGIRIIVTNLDLIEALAEIFERNGFVVEGIIPSAIFAGYNTKKILDQEFAKSILSNKNLLRQGNMLQKIEATQTPTETTEPKSKNKLLPYLLAGFGILLVILVVALLLRK